jgi:hypothetical protein
MCQGKRTSERPRHWWKNNIRIEILKIVYEGKTGSTYRDRWREGVNTNMEHCFQKKAMTT